MRRAMILVLAIVVFLPQLSCQTTSSGTDKDSGNKNGIARSTGDNDGSATPQGDERDESVVKEMEAYFNNAVKKLDEMALSEAINQFVAVLALRNGLPSPAKKAKDLAARAETELTKIEAGLLLQAGSEWLDDNSNLVAASSLTAGKKTSLNPKVLLWYNVGGSRIAVSAVPVVFEFTKGSGLITGFVTTNEYGEASVPLAKIDNPNKETVIRASVVYTVKGYTYRFSQTKLEFVYLPPSKRATILVLERGPEYIAEDPYIFNAVYKTLKKMEFDFIPFNGRLLGNEFMNIFGGDLTAIKKLTLEQNVPYMVVVLNDCYSVRKIMELRNAYVGEGKSTLRIVRVVDGKILFEAIGYADKQHGTHGQGSSEEKTMRDVFVRASVQLESELDKKTAEINRALGID